MKITRFQAQRVHGFLNYDILFDDQLTFITGINGSGKTSVLNAILALISPSFATLAALTFSRIEVDVEHELMSLSISAEQTDGQTTLRVSSSDDPLTFKHYTPDPDVPSYKRAETEAEYYRELTARNAQHDVINAIGKLPTPMFLGLDRRARFGDDERPLRYAPRPSRTTRNITGFSASVSVYDAIALAETVYRDTLIVAGQMVENQRRDMLLQLISMRPEENFPGISPPTTQDLRLLRSMKEEVAFLPEILGLNKEEVNSRVLPFLNELQEAIETMPGKINLPDLFANQDDVENQQVIQALMFWSVNKPGLARLQALTEQTAQYNKRKSDLVRRAGEYLAAVNTFLGDSGKTVEFNERGYIAFRIRGASGARELFTLSSGEAQLFVILTHLFFHPQAQSANVFIIDEPELSLHVQWQEMLVASMQAASPSVQYIMATHSPSIIQDRIANCVDISPVHADRD